MIHNFGSVGKYFLCLQFQEHMSIINSQYLRSYVGTYVHVNDQRLNSVCNYDESLGLVVLVYRGRF